MALGALQALKAAGVENVKIYGVGAYKEACDAIKRHDMEATALHPSYLVGVYTVRAAYDALHGRSVLQIIAPTGQSTPTTWRSSSQSAGETNGVRALLTKRSRARERRPPGACSRCRRNA